MDISPYEVLAAWGMQHYKHPPLHAESNGVESLLIQLGIQYDSTIPLVACRQVAKLLTDATNFVTLDATLAWIEKMKRRYDHLTAQTDRMIDVHRQLFALHGITGHLEPRNWMFYGFMGKLEKYLKFALADLFAVIAQQEERPARPDIFHEGLPWAGGAMSTFRRKCIFHKTWKGKRKSWAIQFGYTLYQSKGGSLPVPAEFVEDTLNDMEERVCEPRQLPYIDQVMDDMIEQCIRTVDEVCDDLQIDRPELKHIPAISKVPSLHSSVQSYRKTMGTQNWIFRDVPEPYLGTPYLLGHAGDHLIYGPYDPEDIELALSESRLAAMRNVGRGVDCEPVPLLEPFKVRVITRGDADNQHLSRRWQSYVFASIAKHPNLQLMGGPIGPEALAFLTERSNADDGRKWISADYSAATDNLNPDVSEALLSRLTQRLGIPFEDSLCLRENLTRHNVKSSKSGEVRRQRWGQLMGSPVSFYILCLANLALTRWALELANGCVGDFPLLSLPLLVNGDDAGFRANPTEYTVWKAITEAGGLTPSIGKNYSSEDWLILNSQLFQMRIQEVKMLGKTVAKKILGVRRPIVCSTLLYCRARSIPAWEKDVDPNRKVVTETGGFMHGRSISECSKALIELHTEEFAERLIKTFVKVNADAIDQARLPGMPLHTPKCFGGMGIPGKPNPKFVLYFSGVENRMRLSKSLSGSPKMAYMSRYLDQLPVCKGPARKVEKLSGMSYFVHLAEPVEKHDIEFYNQKTAWRYQKLIKRMNKSPYQGPLPVRLTEERLEGEEYTYRANPLLLRMLGESVGGFERQITASVHTRREVLRPMIWKLVVEEKALRAGEGD